MFLRTWDGAADSYPVSRNWFVAQLKPNQDLIARQNLGRQGIEHFMPEVIRERLTAKGPKAQRKALFPGYLFVALNLASSSWTKVRSTRGISRLISFGGGMPCPLPAAFVNELMGRMEGDGLLRPEPGVTEGSVVRVTRGPFSEFIGKVERLDDEQRAWLLLEFLGQESRVSIRVESLELVRK